MIRKIFNTLLFITSAACIYTSLNCLHDKLCLVGIFISGLLFGIFLMNIRLNVKNDKLNLYKRELEKESISSTESDAKIKVLETKIKVLEKALENSLNK